MPQVLKPTVIQEITSSQGEVVVKLEITLNINMTQSGVTVEAEAAPKPKSPPAPPTFVNKGLDYIIPDFSDQPTELIQFGKEE